MNHNVGREYETCRSFAIVWIRWWIDNEWINWFFTPIWAWLFDFPWWTAIILELFELWLNVQFSQGAAVVLLLLELSVIDRKLTLFCLRLSDGCDLILDESVILFSHESPVIKLLWTMMIMCILCQSSAPVIPQWPITIIPRNNILYISEYLESPPRLLN